MKEDLLKRLLESILGGSKSARGGDEAVFTCPSCNHHKKKLTFNLLSQKFPKFCPKITFTIIQISRFFNNVFLRKSRKLEFYK